MDKKLQALFGLKFNPFMQDIPVNALFIYDELNNFFWRIENTFIKEGGFALLSGDPGTGKSAALRIMEDKLSQIRDIQVGVITHPSAGLSDFYRELGDIFGVPLRVHNRWNAFKSLREKWAHYLETTLIRPVLFIDEAQEMPASVLNELRLLTSIKFDSQLLMSIVLSGDHRLSNKFKKDELLPLSSRIKIRFNIEYASTKQLMQSLKHILSEAGNSQLMTLELMKVLCEHSLGNYRVLYNLCSTLLSAAVQKELTQIDEQLYFECFPAPSSRRSRK